MSKKSSGTTGSKKGPTKKGADKITKTTAKKSAAPLTGKVEKQRIRRKSYVMDLRICSPTSLGYLGIEGLDTAPALVRLAKVKRLDIIAVTDFYHAGFVDKLVEAAAESEVTVVPGVVIRAAIPQCNDVILACFFPEEGGAESVQEFLKRLNVPAHAANNSNFIVPHSLHAILDILDELQGTAIPSRMDQTPYRREAIPILVEEYGFRAFDLAHLASSIEYFKARWRKSDFELMSFSNAGALAQVGSRSSKVKMIAPGYAGIRTIAMRQEG